MTRDLIIGVEINRNETAAVVFDREGRDIAVAAFPNSTGSSVYARVLRALCEHLPGLEQRTAALAATHDRGSRDLDVSALTQSGSHRLRWEPRSVDPAELRSIGLEPGIPAFVDGDAALAAAIAAGLFDGSRPACSVVEAEEAHFAHPNGHAPAVVYPDLGSATIVRQSGPGVLWLLELARDLLIDFGPARCSSDVWASFEADVLAAIPGELLFEADASPQAADRSEATARSHVFGLSTRHGFGHLLRAAFERFAVASSSACERSQIEEVRLAGPAAGSEALQQIVASVAQIPTRALQRKWPAAAGAALMAAQAIGQENDLVTAGSRWITPYLGPLTQPDARLADTYDRLRAVRHKAYEASAPVRSGVRVLPEPEPGAPKMKAAAA